MRKIVLNESEQKITNGVKDEEFKAYLTEGFLSGDFMTTEEFCQKLETLKTSLINKHSVGPLTTG